jgi:hypothetical protein
MRLDIGGWGYDAHAQNAQQNLMLGALLKIHFA